MPLSLALTDDGDDTGATATIAGASGSTSVYVARWSGGFVNADWILAGSRSGDGVLSLSTLAAGFWWAYALNGVTHSPMTGVHVTTGLDPLFYRLLIATQEKIQALELTGLTSAQVIVQKFPFNIQEAKVGVFINPIRESVTPKVAGRDDIDYPVQVSYFVAANRNLTSNMSRSLNWRDQISRVTRNQYWAGFTEQFGCSIEAGPVFDPALFSNLFDAGSLVLRIKTRETRGV